MAILLVALCATQGCYKRTISARGMGADQYDLSEPYQENSKVDDWIFGEREDNQRNRSLLNR
jgi:hypothetical protein